MTCGSLQNFWPIFDAVNAALEKAITLAKDGRKGGYFVLRDGSDGHVLLALLFGSVPREKTQKYHDLAFEKGERLLGHPDHLSSSQSRNETELKYGGGIRGKKYIYSFSGLEEPWDEAVMLVTAEILDDLERDAALLIAETSKNDKYKLLAGAIALPKLKKTSVN